MSVDLPGLKLLTSPVTSAALDRFEVCPGSAVYRPTAKEKISYGAWHGIFVHRFLEYTITKGYDAALAYIRTKRMLKTVRTCEQIDVDALPNGVPEIGWAHNPIDDTARQLPNVRALSNVMDATIEQYGRADLVSFDSRDRKYFDGESRPLITDWKTGAVDGSTRPDQNSQLLGLAASMRADTGHAEIDVALAHIPQSGEVAWTISTLSKQHLDAYVVRAKRVQLQVVRDRNWAARGIAPEFVRSDEACTWCKCRPHCPAWR